ncbi:MAG: DUF3090 family protein [Actinomycetes bacterium]
MSRIVYNHEYAERFVVGTVGAPGERAFFLQIDSPIYSNCVAIEKTQVAALSERFKEMIQELRRNKLASLDELSYSAQVINGEMQFPITEDFQVGIIGISWDQNSQRINLEVQAVSDIEVEDLISEDADENDLLPDVIRVPLRIFQVRNFCTQADRTVASGRQPCPFCGLPIDVEGHLCPRANGYRR